MTYAAELARDPSRASVMRRGCGHSLALALLVVLALTACSATVPSLSADAPSSEAGVPEQADPAAEHESSSAGGFQDPRPLESAALPEDAVPVRVSIPEIDVSSSLEDLALEPWGELQAPVDFDLAGWFTGGVVPGEVGPAIIAGHVNSPNGGGAVFTRLAELGTGSRVVVEMSSGDELTFQISGSTQSEKSNFPSSEVYGNVPTPQLRIITCARPGAAGERHLDNLILFAELVES